MPFEGSEFRIGLLERSWAYRFRIKSRGTIWHLFELRTRLTGTAIGEISCLYCQYCVLMDLWLVGKYNKAYYTICGA
jgi:hypothetical protein